MSIIFEPELFRCAGCGETIEDEAGVDEVMRVAVSAERAPERDRGDNLALVVDRATACKTCLAHGVLLFVPRIELWPSTLFRGRNHRVKPS